ncbi:MAG: hypothetical protein K0R84_696 [Clostridia bacterium]|jgi:hypothetical protein|nr:hypothetical protein [Clostridia bacterium]
MFIGKILHGRDFVNIVSANALNLTKNCRRYRINLWCIKVYLFLNNEFLPYNGVFIFFKEVNKYRYYLGYSDCNNYLHNRVFS